MLNESTATVAEAAHALGVDIAKTLWNGRFCDSQSNAGNIDSVLQT